MPLGKIRLHDVAIRTQGMALINGKRAHVRSLETKTLLRHALDDCRRQYCRQFVQVRAAFNPTGPLGEPAAELPEHV